MPIKAVIRYYSTEDAHKVMSILSHCRIPILKTKLGPAFHSATILLHGHAELSDLLASINDRTIFDVSVVSTKFVWKM